MLLQYLSVLCPWRCSPFFSHGTVAQVFAPVHHLLTYSTVTCVIRTAIENLIISLFSTRQKEEKLGRFLAVTVLFLGGSRIIRVSRLFPVLSSFVRGQYWVVLVRLKRIEQGAVQIISQLQNTQSKHRQTNKAIA